MNTLASENTAEPAVHRDNIRLQLTELIDHLKADVERIVEPRFQALLETSAEVLKGVRTAFEHYDEHRERAAQAVAARAAARPPRPAGRTPNPATSKPAMAAAPSAPPVSNPSSAPGADPDELAAKAALQKKAARSPQRPHTSAAVKTPPQSGKPVWKKPHSS